MLQIFSVRDIKADSYGVPFFCSTVGVAARQFTELVNDVNTMVSKYPEDYELWCLGDFEPATGEIFPSRAMICTALSVKRDA